MLRGERKSVEPIAAVTAPARVAAQHQSLRHFVGEGRGRTSAFWPRCARWFCLRSSVKARSRRRISNDTGLPKKGRHSVGVARQYGGQLGKEDNCQVAVSLSIAIEHASLPVAYCRRDGLRTAIVSARCGFPKILASRPGNEIELEQLRWACAAGLPRGVALRGLPVMAITAICAPTSRAWGCPTSRAFCRTRRCGRTGPDRCRRSHGPAAPGQQSACGATPSIGRSRLKSLRSACPRAPGAPSNGEKVRQKPCPRVLRGCGCVPRGVTKGATSRARKNSY